MTILQHITHQDNDIVKVKKRVDVIESRERSLDSDQIMKDINDLEWQSRKLNIKFHGICLCPYATIIKVCNRITQGKSLG